MGWPEADLNLYCSAPEVDVQYVTEMNGTVVVTTDGQPPLHLYCTGSDGPRPYPSITSRL